MKVSRWSAVASVCTILLCGEAHSQRFWSQPTPSRQTSIVCTYYDDAQALASALGQLGWQGSMPPVMWNTHVGLVLAPDHYYNDYYLAIFGVNNNHDLDWGWQPYEEQAKGPNSYSAGSHYAGLEAMVVEFPRAFLNSFSCTEHQPE